MDENLIQNSISICILYDDAKIDLYIRRVMSRSWRKLWCEDCVRDDEDDGKEKILKISYS